MNIPRPINRVYIHVRKYYLDAISRFYTPQYGVHILNGHYIDAANKTGNQVFFDTLNELSKEVDFISFKEGNDLVYSKKIPANQKLVCLSFDDGYEECFTKIKPVLDAFDMKAGFFVCPNFIDAPPNYVANFLKKQVFLKTHKQPMSWEQIKTLHTEGHIIGSHTLNHIHCAKTPFDILDTELRESKRIIEAKLQMKCEHFAYTYGKLEDFSFEALEYVERYYKYIYSQANHSEYFSFNGRVINRRHFEGNWSKNNISYYLQKKYLSNSFNNSQRTGLKINQSPTSTKKLKTIPQQPHSFFTQKQ